MRGRLAAVAAVALIAGALAVWMSSRAPEPAVTAAPAVPVAVRRADRPRAEPESALPSDDADPPGAPAEVDLDLMRAKLPDNRYWTGLKLDETLRGTVLSGTASDDEITRHFDERRQISEDAIAFSRAVLDEYGDRLGERDRRLYELVIEMHTTRLDDLPRDEARARARHREQEERRAAFRR